MSVYMREGGVGEGVSVCDICAKYPFRVWISFQVSVFALVPPLLTRIIPGADSLDFSPTCFPTSKVTKSFPHFWGQAGPGLSISPRLLATGAWRLHREARGPAGEATWGGWGLGI